MILKTAFANCCHDSNVDFWHASVEHAGSGAIVGNDHGECGQRTKPVDLWQSCVGGEGVGGKVVRQIAMDEGKSGTVP